MYIKLVAVKKDVQYQNGPIGTISHRSINHELSKFFLLRVSVASPAGFEPALPP